MQRSLRVAAVLAAGVVLAACSDAARAPTGVAADAGPAVRRVPAAERTTATVRWNALARDFVVAPFSPLIAARIFAVLSVAQYNAVIAAEDGKAGRLHPSEAGAVAGASATVLAAVFPTGPTAGQRIAAQLAADAAYFPTLPSERDADWASGVAIGRAEAARVLAYAATDGSATPWIGSIPVGPGLWTFVGTPALPRWGEVRPWVLDSGSQFRSAPPPAFGSAEFQVALAEVYRTWSTRTPEQQAEAVFWQSGYGASATAGHLSIVGAELAERQHLDERKTARAFALLHMAIMDASIGCWEAKYFYWFLRPYNADPRISSSVGGPVAHPSYPSGHSCLTSAGATVLAALFPSAADEMAELTERAGMARIYAGIHYRFDIDAGRALGVAVAELTLATAPRGHEPIPLD